MLSVVVHLAESLQMSLGKTISLCTAVGCTSLLLGCGGGQVEYTGARVETTAVTGTVLVDGVPASTILATCVAPNAEPDEVVSSAFTDTNGEFSLGTYDGGDGIPAGSYIMLFESKELRFGKPGYGIDKFEGRYTDPATSEFKITVVNGEPVNMGEIELSTK